MRPYRLINASEMISLNQHFKQIVLDWNEKYSTNPLSFQLSTLKKNHSILADRMLRDPNHPLALIAGDYLQIMKLSLFGNTHACFNAASQELTLVLLNNLCQTKQAHIAAEPLEKPDWFYPGSTALLFTLGCNAHHYTLVLHPDLAYQQLSLKNPDYRTLNPLDDALAEYACQLNVNLMDSRLSVKSLTEIQIGDVLTTDHPLTTPLKLTRGKHILAYAELGQSLPYKSIILKKAVES